MSTFSVEIVELDDVQPHPNADLLELAVIGGYRAVVGKGLHQKGDMVLYIPEEALAPR
jgi:RNA ligase (TIGR02306 family)